jgi:hypothetical protein
VAADEEQVSLRNPHIYIDPFLRNNLLTINRIISLVTPLMRRMVTNERQRMYALETRKNLAAAKQGQNEKSRGSATPTVDSPRTGSQPEAPSTPSALDIDPKLNSYHYSIGSPATQGQHLGVGTPPATGTSLAFAKNAADDEGLKYHVSIMQDDRRLVPRFTLTPNICPTFLSLVQHVNSAMDDGSRNVGAIKVMCPGGLVEATDEKSWAEAVEIIRHTEWMDEEVRCIVHVR